MILSDGIDLLISFLRKSHPKRKLFKKKGKAKDKKLTASEEASSELNLTPQALNFPAVIMKLKD